MKNIYLGIAISMDRNDPGIKFLNIMEEFGWKIYSTEYMTPAYSLFLEENLNNMQRKAKQPPEKYDEWEGFQSHTVLDVNYPEIPLLNSGKLDWKTILHQAKCYMANGRS